MSRSWVRVGVHAVVLVIGLMAGTAAAAPGAHAADGDVTLRLVLRGAVPATDSFTIGINVTSSSLTGLGGFFCGPPDNAPTEQGPLCSARAFDSELRLPIGTAIDFTFARNSGDLDAPRTQVLYEGSATVSDAPQTFTVVYDYSLSGGALPDTSLRHPAQPSNGGSSSWHAISAVAIATAVVLGIRRRTQPKPLS
jgi:hypothetical protein